MPKKKITLTCKDPGRFFHSCEGCKFYDECDYFNKIERKKNPNPQADCNHSYEFKNLLLISGMGWVDRYECQKCGKEKNIKRSKNA